MLSTGRMTSLSAIADAGDRYRQNDMEAETEHQDLSKLEEAERKLRLAREANNERVDQDTLAELTKPKEKPKKEEDAPAEDEEGEGEADAEATEEGGEEEAGDEDFE
jgi:hypothetical protein